MNCRKIWAIMAVALSMTACTDDKSLSNVTACFDYSPTETLAVGDTIKFLNCSANADSYRWNFGDNNFSLSETPSHIYKKAGTFVVELISINAESVDTANVALTIVPSVELYGKWTGVVEQDTMTFTFADATFSWTRKNGSSTGNGSGIININKPLQDYMVMRITSNSDNIDQIGWYYKFVYTFVNETTISFTKSALFTTSDAAVNSSTSGFSQYELTKK